MQINITITIEDGELKDGNTVGQLIAEKFGGAVRITQAPAAPVDPPAPVDPEVVERLAEIDTSEEDDALDAGDWTEPPAIPPSTAVAAPAAEPSAPTPPVAAPAVVPPVAAPVAEAVQAPGTPYVHGVEVDSAGVPWNASLHSSNKKQYGAGSGGAKAGRWQWKRGTDALVPAREEQAAQLAADLKSAAQPAVPAAAPVAAPGVPAAPAAATPAAAAPIPMAENAAPAPVTAGVLPPAAAVQPVVAPVVSPVVASTPAAAVPTVSAGGWTWANFLESMTATGTTAEAVLGLAAQHGVTTIPELSPRVDILEAVAVALAWPAPAVQA